MQDNYSQPIFDEINTSTFIETENVCSHQNHLYGRSNFIGENIFVVEFSITCDHQNLASSSIDSPLEIDPINKINSLDIRILPVHSPIISFHDPILSDVSVTNANNLICPFDSPNIGLPCMDFIFLDHTLHYNFHEKIVEWLENSYLKRISETGKHVLSLHVNRISNGKDGRFCFSFLLYYFWLLLEEHIILVGLEMFRWFHWLFHFT